MSESVYHLRMNGYYPEVIRSIAEFQGIIDGEYPEFELLANGVTNTQDSAYLLTMDETRIAQWETVLHITPRHGSTVEDRRNTIIARIRGQNKLNSATISNIVNAFTGGSATSWVKDSVLYVEITPPPNNRQYFFENVVQELSTKVPAHLRLDVRRNYYTWGEIDETYETWQDLKNTFDHWEDVLLYIRYE